VFFLDVPPTVSDVRLNPPGEVWLAAEPVADFQSWWHAHTQNDVNRFQLDLAFAEKSLDELGDLTADWDGYGALAIAQATLDNTRAVIRNIIPNVPSPEVTPNPNGTVTLSWESAFGEAHIEIGNTRFSFFAKQTGSRAIPAQGKVSDIVPTDKASVLAGIIRAVVYPDIHAAQTITMIVYAANGKSARL
jgi:hypothetical protein